MISISSIFFIKVIVRAKSKNHISIWCSGSEQQTSWSPFLKKNTTRRLEDFTAQDSKHQLGIQLCLSQLLYSWPSNDLGFWHIPPPKRTSMTRNREAQKKTIYGGVPKMVVPNNHGFSYKDYHFGVFWGYHHLGKHPHILQGTVWKPPWCSRFSRYENLDDPFRIKEKRMAKSPDMWPIYIAAHIYWTYITGVVPIQKYA